MKNKIAVTLGVMMLGLMLAPAALAAYERSWRISATNVDDRRNNMTVDYQGETYLLHYKKGCGDIEEGDELILTLRGDLDGNLDKLRKGTREDCIVDQAEVVNSKVLVTKTSGSDRTTTVEHDGIDYRIHYSPLCSGMRGLNGQEVYIQQFGSKLDVGDILRLPGGGERCPLTSVTPQDTSSVEDRVPEPKNIDVKRPTTPTRFRAIPTKTGVYLYWNAASDNEAISHYIISAGLYHTEDERIREPSDELPTLPDVRVTPTNKPSYKLTNLLPDELYFLRVAAVDTSGNTSPYWSQEATAFTKSAIKEFDLRAESTPLKLEIAQETDHSFLIRWNRIPSSATHVVILEVDNVRNYIHTNWTKNYIRILKKNNRKGKDLELKVRTYNTRGQRLEDTIDFSF